MIIILIFLAIPIVESTLEYEYYPVTTDQYKGKLEVSGGFELGEIVFVTFSIEPIRDLPNTTIRIILPREVEHITGETQWKGDVKKGERVVLINKIKNKDAGKTQIVADAASRNKDGKLVAYRGYYKSLEIKGSGEPIENNINALSTQSQNSGAYQNSLLITDGANEHADHPIEGQTLSNVVTITGRWLYEDILEGIKPLKGALVKVFEDGIIIDVERASGKTDSNGYYSFNIDVGSGLNLYVAIYCETDAAKVTDYLNRFYYGTTSTRFVTKSNESSWHFEWRYFELKYANWEALNHVTDEYNWIKNKVGWNRDKIQVKYPAGGWPVFAHNDLTGANNIDLPDREQFFGGDLLFFTSMVML